MTAYYNELDPYCADWLENLIEAGHIAPGVVDRRDIRDVHPDQLQEFTQCHFFAGVGVWSYAARRAGWSDDSPLWTGSCPCQPFSAAGRGGGVADERHLWPHWHYLISECKPGIVFGEQVASKDGLGWLDLVQADLEGTGYASAALDLCAAGFGAPHIRQRSYFVAQRLGDAHGARLERHTGHGDDSARRSIKTGPTAEAGGDGRLADTDGGNASAERQQRGGQHGQQSKNAGGGDGDRSPHPTNGHWADVDWLGCRDGKFRPVEPGTFPLVNGAAGRVGRLRAYGNAIVAPQAQAFIEAYLETLPE